MVHEIEVNAPLYREVRYGETVVVFMRKPCRIVFAGKSGKKPIQLCLPFLQEDRDMLSIAQRRSLPRWTDVQKAKMDTLEVACLLAQPWCLLEDIDSGWEFYDSSDYDRLTVKIPNELIRSEFLHNVVETRLFSTYPKSLDFVNWPDYRNFSLQSATWPVILDPRTSQDCPLPFTIACQLCVTGTFVIAGHISGASNGHVFLTFLLKRPRSVLADFAQWSRERHRTVDHQEGEVRQLTLF